jgi:endonuclease-3
VAGKQRSADAVVVSAALDERWPEARCELLARDPWELLVAVILSARTADARVNQVMAVLNEHFTGVEAYQDLDPRALGSFLARLPLHRQKARAITEAARYILYRCDGTVPRSIDELVRIPGVGRKTAAVVAGNAFNHPAVAADSHVQRIAHRLGWAIRADAVVAEAAIEAAFERADWVRRCHQLIRLGRDCCRPMRPWCSRCPVAGTCPQVGVSDAR